MRTALSGLGTASMPAPHGVGAVTLEMTPSDSMCSSLTFTFGCIGRGTLQGCVEGKWCSIRLEVNLEVTLKGTKAIEDSEV